MKITVYCDCGKPFRFDDEAVGGRVQHRVICPNCGADGTSKANDFVAAAARGETIKAPAAKGAGWQFWKKPEIADEFGDAAEAALLAPPSKAKIALGAVGAIAGGAIGMAAWYFLIKTTGSQIGFLAWGIGLLVGFGARLFVPQGSFALAGVAAVTACVAILGGQALGYKFWVNVGLTKAIQRSYDEETKFAKQVIDLQKDEDRLISAISTSGYQLRAAELPNDPKALRMHYHVLADLEARGFGILSSGGKRTSMADYIKNAIKGGMNAAELKEFREKDLPELQALADGKPPKEEFVHTLNTMAQARISLNELILQSFSAYTFVFLVLGIGTAWKMANNSSDAVSD